MTEEVQALAEVDSAPTTDVTATPEVAESTPEVAENQVDQATEEKKYSQAEIDAMIGKRLAREQRKWEREQQQRSAETQIVKAAPSASVDQFESPEAYAEALAYQKAEELLAKREAAKQQSQVLESYHDLEEEARTKYDDFEQVAYNPKLPITNVMAETIQSSDVGPELAYYLGSNPKEADRISRMSPLSQAKEIGKIEAKLVSSPPVKKTTSAPAPISPVTARSAGAATLDTTDPRSIKSMTASQWIEAERARQIKKLQAQNR
jgi:hypothetical protein